MNTNLIDKEEALAALRRAVEKKGKGHKVKVCHYFHRGNKTPVCIVGHVISDLGLKALREAILKDKDKGGAFRTNNNGNTIDQIPEAREFFTPDAIAALNRAQDVQDGRKGNDSSWGSAAWEAKEGSERAMSDDYRAEGTSAGLPPETSLAAYPKFGSIPRLHRECIITEKIDGTNGLIHIESAPDGPTAADGVAVYDSVDADDVPDSGSEFLWVRAGCRSRWITPKEDNHGFARWVYDNATELAKLGPGHHYGEWYGSGINRGYGLPKGEKRFALFNVDRWAIQKDRVKVGRKGGNELVFRSVAPQNTLPTDLVTTVPVLQVVAADRMPRLSDIIEGCLENLRRLGSFAEVGFTNPEGIVIQHIAAGQLFKVTLESDRLPKSVRNDWAGMTPEIEDAIIRDAAEAPRTNIVKLLTEFNEVAQGLRSHKAAA